MGTGLPWGHAAYFVFLNEYEEAPSDKAALDAEVKYLKHRRLSQPVICFFSILCHSKCEHLYSKLFYAHSFVQVQLDAASGIYHTWQIAGHRSLSRHNINWPQGLPGKRALKIAERAKLFFKLCFATELDRIQREADKEDEGDAELQASFLKHIERAHERYVFGHMHSPTYLYFGLLVCCIWDALMRVILNWQVMAQHQKTHPDNYI